MALHWRPVGPDPEQTYWQRRAVVAVALAVSLFLLVLVLGRAFGGDTVQTGDQAVGSPQPSPASPSASPLIGPAVGASADASPTPAVAACTEQALTIEATVDKQSYPVGGRPRLTLTVANTGAAPCTADLGQAAVELLVFSGNDRIWSSDDCAPGGPVAVETLAPGAAKKLNVTWAGKRSRPKCAGEQEAARAGTYRVSGRVGERTVQGQVFRLT